MTGFCLESGFQPRAPLVLRWRIRAMLVPVVWLACVASSLMGCSSVPVATPVQSGGVGQNPMNKVTGVTSGAADAVGTVWQSKGRWVPVSWSELPGFGQDNLFEAWNAWLKSCERPVAVFAVLCAEVRQMSIGSADEQHRWIQQRLQAFRVESAAGDSLGLLTAYYEPVLQASRHAGAGYAVPLYQPPAGLGQRKPWYSRQEMETLPQAQSALQGKVIAYLANPVDALTLQIQGSGRLRVSEPDGSDRWVRLSYGGTNGHPYRSIGRWLLDQGLVTDASWSGIKSWLSQNPQRQQELLWVNPRVTFFREETAPENANAEGPRGAHGVALTPGRSIAVDPSSIPYGTPVWLASSGPHTTLQKLVLAQDTGSAITGAVRADYFVGAGPDAGELAGRLRQPLQLWALWPK
jgi:membrane-bound lytic murein transglycosylase A